MNTKPTSTNTESNRQHGGQILKFGLAVGLAALVAIGGLALLVNIMEHKQDAKNPFFRVVELTDDTEDPAVWGKNFPVQYDAYLKTVDQVRTKYGGSDALPKTPTQADPRSIIAQSKIEEDPRLKKMWQVMRSRLISARNAATPSCWTTRRLPAGKPNPNPAPA